MKATDDQISAWLKRYPPNVIDPPMTGFDIFECGFCTALHTNLTKHVRSHIEEDE